MIILDFSKYFLAFDELWIIWLISFSEEFVFTLIISLVFPFICTANLACCSIPFLISGHLSIVLQLNNSRHSWDKCGMKGINNFKILTIFVLRIVWLKSLCIDFLNIL